MGAQDQRPRFYEGQYLGAGDLAAIVDYLRAADARHALGAHTWGIAIGLYLLERPAPGPGGRREVIVTPGIAWDGYGRAIMVTRPTRLPEELCAAIPYEDHLDGADPKGRPVRVWLNYSETAARQPAPGFESCAEDAQNSRVAESFEFVVGAVPEGLSRHGSIAIGSETLPGREALKRFDAAAPELHDMSVPHQTFPAERRRWLIPVGFVRWIARENELGYFAARDGVPEYKLNDCTRGFRRYIGAVVENLVAADRAIVLQRRDKDPRERHQLAWLLNCGRKTEELLEDLVWVEGNLRVVLGDAKLAGGKLHFRDADGGDQGVPLYFARTGDDAKADEIDCCKDLDAGAAAERAKKPRELRVAIGKKGQNQNRLIVGPELAAAKPEEPPTLVPRFVVTSGLPPTSEEKEGKDTEGRAGVNTRDPNAALEVKGDWNGEDGAIRVTGAQPAIRYEGGDDVGKAAWIAQLTATPLGAYRIAYRIPPAPPSTKGTWKGVVNVLPEKVGIRSDAPGAPLGVRADGDRVDLVSFEDKGGAKKWTINLKPDANTGFNLHETAADKSRLFVQPGGNVGLGTTTPQQALHVAGNRIRLEQGGKRIELRADGGAVDLQSDTHTLYLHSLGPAGSNHVVINPHPQNGKVGIGTAAPRSQLEVKGNADSWGTAAFVPATSKGGRQSHVHWGETGDWYISSADEKGRVILQDGDGDVGIGTKSPKEKLHVRGNFIRVDGAGNEQAYIGGDGSDVVVDRPWPSPDVYFAKYVQIGSLDSSLKSVHLWNRGSTDWMWLVCKGILVGSDARRKTNIRSLSGALDRVARLRGVEFKWKQAEGDEAEAPAEIGVIAQEVAEVVPEAVKRARGNLFVSYNELVTLLIEAVKELKAEVDELRGQVQKLSSDAPKKRRKD